MKLATALAERSDIQNRINTISVRLDNNAKVQEGDIPAEDPKALMEELDRLIVRLEDLVARINLTNSGTVYEGRTITELLAHRDCLKKKVRVLTCRSQSSLAVWRMPLLRSMDWIKSVT